MSYFDFKFTFGMHEGKPLYDVPVGYLRWAAKNLDSISESDRATIRREIQRQEERLHDQGYGNYRPAAPPPSPTPVAVDAEIGLLIVREGRRALARRLHPDRGGDPEAMTRCNATADFLEKRLSLLLGASA